VIKVNDKSYTMGYLLKLLRMFQRGSQVGGQGLNLGSLPFELVNTLAENELIRQGAPKSNLTVTREQVDGEVRKRFLGETPAQQQTPQEQLEREFQERYRQYLNLVQFTEEEHRQIVTYELYREKMRELLGQQVNRVQPQAHLYAIEIPPVENALRLIDEFRTEYARGAPFAELLAQPKLAQNAEAVRKNGEVGWVPQGVLPNLDDLLFKELEPCSKPEQLQGCKLSDAIPQVEPGGGGTRYTIYLVRERAEAREVEERHLETLKTRALQEWLNKERQSNKVEISFDSNRYEWLINKLRLSAPGGNRGPARGASRG
jgi:hypothetical protein